MISSISIKNVRLFRGDRWEFPLAQLSVFCGTNSAGKSTLLNTLLLLRQSAIVPESYEGIEGGLRFVSKQADLGSYDAFVSDHKLDKDIQIEIELEERITESAVEDLRDMLKEEGEKTRKRKGSASSRWMPYTLKCSFTFGIDKRKLTDELISQKRPRASLKEEAFTVNCSGETLLHWKIRSTVGKQSEEKNVKRYELLLPDSYVRAAIPFLKSLGIDPDTNLHRFQTTLPGILPAGIRAQWNQRRRESKEEQPYRNWMLPPHLNFIIKDFRMALDNLHYLGPLRSPAKRYYVANLDDAPDLDSTGEFLPAILHTKGEEQVFGIPDQSELATLETGLNYWIHYLRTGKSVEDARKLDEIRLTTTKNVLIELLLKTPSGVASHALADSGFGYSQVLPILVRGLLAKQGSTLIIEQPELHLNPALQVRLAAFFIELTRLGKQVFIETHSEHLVNALRVLTAEDESQEISQKLSIFFMEVDANGPVVHRLDVKPDGTVPEWPATFFGEAISLSTRLLKAQRRFITKETSGTK